MDPDVSSDTVRRFMSALHEVEQEGRTGPLVDLVTDDAEVRSIDGRGVRRGGDGMDELFTKYLAQFDTITTTFDRATEQDGRASLEWSSEATLADGGSDVRYTGVTTIEVSDDAVTSFSTIYDSAALLHPVADVRPTDDAGSGGARTGGDQGGDGQDGRSEEQAGGSDTTIGHYGADSGFLPEADREAATGADS
jgi:hypothetical protein